jgi:hypothetical protein
MHAVRDSNLVVIRKLQARYSKREAKAVATAFGLFTPVSLAGSLMLAQLGGSLIGALIVILVINTLLSFAVCLFVLRMTLHIEKTQTTL